MRDMMTRSTRALQRTGTRPWFRRTVVIVLFTGLACHPQRRVPVAELVRSATLARPW